jgi:hypothetical protein
MFRSNQCDPGREMSYTDCGFHLVLPLSPRSPGSVGFDDDLLLQGLGIGIKVLLHRFDLFKLRITSPKIFLVIKSMGN